MQKATDRPPFAVSAVIDNIFNWYPMIADLTDSLYSVAQA